MISDISSPEKGVWISPSTNRPPNEEHILVYTTSNLIFLAFRKSNNYHCCAPLPEGVASATLEEFEISYWMIPTTPPKTDEDKEE